MKYAVHVQYDRNAKWLILSWQDPLTGARRRKSAKTNDRREAERRAKKLADDLELKGDITAITWERFRQRFEDEHLANKKPATRANYYHALNRFERQVGKPVRLDEIRASTLSHWAAKMKAENIRSATVASNLRFVRGALSWAHKIGMIQSVPPVIMPPQSRSRGRAISWLEFLKLLRAIKADSQIGELERKNFSDLVKGLWLSGLRLSEALQLSADGGPVHLQLDGPRPMIAFSDQKNGKLERIPITPDFYRFAKRLRRSGPLFGLHMKPSTIGKRLSQYGKTAGVQVSESKHLSAHDLRRTFGQRWAIRLHPIVLQKIMRHSSMETTLRYYVNLKENELAESIWNRDTFRDSPARPTQ